MNANRYIVITEDSGRIWTDYAVVDRIEYVRVCRCSDNIHAKRIASALNAKVAQENMLLTDECSHEKS